MKSLFYISLIFFCFSCNYRLFVHKKDVINNYKGYILFYYESDEALFFPWKDTIDHDFLSKNHLNGFRIGSGEKDLGYLRELVTENILVQNVYVNGMDKQYFDMLRLIPVNIQYYWGDGWAISRIEGKQKVNIKYQYRNRNIDLLYQLYDDIYIMRITPTRRSDIKKIDQISDLLKR